MHNHPLIHTNPFQGWNLLLVIVFGCITLGCLILGLMVRKLDGGLILLAAAIAATTTILEAQPSLDYPTSVSNAFDVSNVQVAYSDSNTSFRKVSMIDNRSGKVMDCTLLPSNDHKTFTLGDCNNGNITPMER